MRPLPRGNIAHVASWIARRKGQIVLLAGLVIIVRSR